MMRKILLLSAIAVLFAACQSKSEYTISGKVTDEALEGQKVILSKITENEISTVDSTTIVNGKFKFKGDADNPVLRFITLGEKENQIGSIVMLEPGKINIVYDSVFHLSGSATNNAYNEFEAKQNELSERMNSISEQHTAKTVNGTMTEEEDAELRSEINNVIDESKALNFNFIKTNIDNELGQYMFLTSYNILEAEQQKEILAAANEEYKADENVKRIINQLEAMEAVAIGKDYIDFTMKNPKGESVSLSDFAGKGKYVFIDFWAAWCGPCRNEMPNVVNAYKKYKNKGLEIVGVSFDRDEEEWTSGIKDMHMTWPQMSDLQFWESEAVGLYAIRSIPHTILLDKEGKIIAKDLRGEKLDEKLNELLN